MIDSIEWFDYPKHLPETGIHILVHDGEQVWMIRTMPITNTNTRIKFVDPTESEWEECISGVVQWAEWPGVPKEYQLNKLLKQKG